MKKVKDILKKNALTINDLKFKFPTHIKLWEQIEKLDQKINDESSEHVKSQYYSIIDSLEKFLSNPHTIKTLKETRNL